MPTPVFLTGFEHGVIDSALFSTVTTAGGTPTPVTSTVRTGTYALEINKSSAGVSTVNWNQTGASNQQGVMRVAINVAALPASGTAQLLSIQVTAGSQAKFTIDNTGKLKLNVGNANSDGPVLTLGQWYLVDLWLDPTVTNAFAGKWAINGIAQPNANDTTVQAASTISAFRLGSAVTADVFDCFYDDWICSLTGADYPIGDGYVLGLKPNGDGTHSVGSGTNFTDASGTQITGSTTTAWSNMTDLPLSETTTRVEQRLDTSGLLYVEVTFADTVQGNVNGIRACLGVGGATGSSESGAAKIMRNDSTLINIYSGAISSTSTYMAAIVTPPGGGWTQAEINALKGRVGFGTDVTPDIYFYNLLLEVDYPLILPVPSRCLLQAVTTASVM